MDELENAEFQRAAIQLISEQLRDRDGPRRFLLADEVGLGKTIVARGVLQDLVSRHSKGTFDAVYLCSNAEIAEQNRKRLDPSAARPIRRVTELAYQSGGTGIGAASRSHASRLRLYSFTPGTSLTAGTGLAWERRLLLYLVLRVLRQDVRRQKWRDFFRCTARPGPWMQETQLRNLSREFRRKVSREFQRLVAEEWRKPVSIGGESIIPARGLADEVERFRDEPDGRRRRNQLVQALRIGVQRVALDALRPDLVILDEVQRFRSVIDDAEKADSIAGRLFQSGAAVLILSATPYRMLSLDHEGADHYREFVKTVGFLYGRDGTHEVGALERDLDAYRKRLEEGDFTRANDPELLALKSSIERRLRRVISRTERNWYIEDQGKGVEEVKPAGDGFAVPNREELADYVSLRRYLLDKVETSQHITEYWKSCPSPFTFMDASYVAMAAARRCRRAMPTGLVTPVRDLRQLPNRSLRFRLLFSTVFGSEESWKYLWTRPTYTYYRDEFFGDADPGKMLVFSGWRFVPKAIALLASEEAEQRIRPRSRFWSGDEPAPLRFTDKGSFHVFDVCFPSPALAEMVDPAGFANRGVGREALLERAERALEAALARAGIQVSRTHRTDPPQGPSY